MRVGTGASASSSSMIRSRACAPSAAAWNSAPTRRIGQYASGARRIATSPGRRSRFPAASRRPTVTATRATESVASSSSAAEDRNDSRRVAIVSSRWRSLTDRTVATWRVPRP